jgi:holin-like protein
MVNALLALLAFQLVGEVLVRALNAPVPGPVIGMLLLFLGLRLRGSVPASLQHASQGLLGNLSLLFVPAGVGVIVHLEQLQAEWWGLLLTLLISTVLTMLVTAGLMSGLIRLRGGSGRPNRG